MSKEDFVQAICEFNDCSMTDANRIFNDYDEEIRYKTLQEVKEYFREWDRDIRATRGADKPAFFTLDNIESGIASVWSK